jgi:hypothetical protein
MVRGQRDDVAIAAEVNGNQPRALGFPNLDVLPNAAYRLVQR